MKRILIIAIILINIPLMANYFARGKNAYIYRNYEKAKEYFLKDIKKYDRGDSYYFMGEIEKIQKNYDEAAKYYEQAVAKRMTRKYMINAYWNLIVLTEEKRDFSKVVHYCRDMWRKTKDRSAKKKVESLINRMLWTGNKEAIQKFKEGQSALKRGKKDEAKSLFKEASSLDSSFMAPKFELGMMAYNSDDESLALQYLSEITYRIPYYAEIQLILGDINYKNGNYQNAATNFTSVIDFGFISKSLYNKTILKRGECYYHLRDYALAETDLKFAAQKMKRNLSVHLLLSASYIKQSKFDEALSVLKKAARISRDNNSVLFQTGSIYYHQKDWKYVSYFDRLFGKIKNEDNEKFKKYDRAMKILLEALFKKKKYLRAIAVGKKLLSYSNDYSTMLVMARSYFFMGRYDESIEIFQKLSLQNEDKLLLAKAYSRSGRKDQAKNLLRDLISYSEFEELALQDSLLKKLIAEIKEETRQNQTTESPVRSETN